MYILTHSVARRVTLVYANHWDKMYFLESTISTEHIYLSVKRVYMEIKEREVCVCVCVFMLSHLLVSDSLRPHGL